jgi:murein DD-endopeptidase MepM/ murein hydrolase activator NlpD
MGKKERRLMDSGCEIGTVICACIKVFCILLFLGCSRSKTEPAINGNPEEEAALTTNEVSAGETGGAIEAGGVKETAVPKTGFALIPERAMPGEPLTVAYCGDARSGLQAVLLDSRGRRLTKANFFILSEVEKIWTAVLAVPSTALTGNALIRVESGANTLKELPFSIEDRDFFSETIPLNQENTDLRTLPDPQKTVESEQLWAILSRAGTEIYSGGYFAPPVSSTRRTSLYGSRRVYEYADGNKDTTIHAGVDFGVPTGTQVLACAPGKVVLARNRIVTGNTVILEHLPGLYSLYYHMDTIAVNEGSTVEAGVLLGESGSTGLATGPHLHWEIRVAGENADPDAFLARPVLDKDDIINKLGAY